MLEILKGTVPSFNAHTNPISDAATMVRPANLRGLSADSTLVLVNGKRRHRSSVITLLGGGINDGSQGPDISVIPSVALKQVEVLRDGAAAQYGSDAIAGVLNFALKDDADGGIFQVRHGQYYEGDGDSTEFSGNIGLPLSRDGFANISFQYKTADATSRSEQRPDAQGFIDAGNTAVSDLAQVWGSPEVEDDISIFGNFGLDLGNDREAYAFGNYAERDIRGGFYYRNPHTRGGVFSNDDGATLLVGDLDGVGQGIECPTVNITSDNVLDQADYALIADPNTDVGQNCFAFNEMVPGGFTPNFGGNVTDTSLTFGTRGDLDWGIMYDMSFSWGTNESTYAIYNTVNASMGPESPRDFNPGKHTQTDKFLNLDFVKEFEVDSLAMPLMFAFGYEWHHDEFEVTAGDVASFTAGPLTEQGFGIGSNGFPGFKPAAAGVYSRVNTAFYVDVEAQYTDDFMMAYALRYEDYREDGDDTNYKIAAQYSVTDDFSIRGSVSTGFRAPTVGQSNYSNVQTNLSDGVLVDSALLPPSNPIAAQLGATDLTPEESESYTFGAVLEVAGIHMTVDYYHIEVEDRISQSDFQTLDDGDREKLKEDGVPNVDSITSISFFTNDFDTTTEGVDFVANYSTELFNGDSTFSLAYNWNETTVDKYSDVTGDFKVARLENDLPNHRGTLTWSQAWESFSMFTRVNYYGEYQGVHVDWDATAIEADSAVTVDIEGTYFVNDAVSLSVGAQNLFDEYPSDIEFNNGMPSNSFGGKYYETSPFGFNGGFWYAKATYTF
jgi:iron complex outermembrane receptor protein